MYTCTHGLRIAQIRSDTCSCPARAATDDHVGVQRVGGSAIVSMQTIRSHSELVHVCLADYAGSMFEQLLDHSRIIRRCVAFQRLRSTARRSLTRSKVVLDADAQTLQCIAARCIVRYEIWDEAGEGIVWIKKSCRSLSAGSARRMNTTSAVLPAQEPLHAGSSKNEKQDLEQCLFEQPENEPAICGHYP